MIPPIAWLDGPAYTLAFLLTIAVLAILSARSERAQPGDSR